MPVCPGLRQVRVGTAPWHGQAGIRPTALILVCLMYETMLWSMGCPWRIPEHSMATARRALPVPPQQHKARSSKPSQASLWVVRPSPRAVPDAVGLQEWEGAGGALAEPRRKLLAQRGRGRLAVCRAGQGATHRLGLLPAMPPGGLPSKH